MGYGHRHAMHSDYHITPRYVPSSPLSTRMATSDPYMPPPTSSPRPRAGQSNLAPRKMHMDLPTFTMSAADRSATVSPSSCVTSPTYGLHRAPQPSPMESAHTLRRGQRDLIKKMRLSSQLAASPAAYRPDAPRLDPLGSPKGPVTPLALEQHEAGDYFALGDGGKYSPAVSPGGRSSRSDAGADKDKKRK